MTPAFLGTQGKRLYLGGRAIRRAYLGDQLVYEALREVTATGSGATQAAADEAARAALLAAHPDVTDVTVAAGPVTLGAPVVGGRGRQSGSHGFAFAWQAVVAAASYDWEARYFTDTDARWSGNTAGQWSDPFLVSSDAVNVYCRARARNAAGPGPWSATESFTRALAPIDASPPAGTAASTFTATATGRAP